LVAVKLFQLWRDTPKPPKRGPFYLIEMGGGAGRLAHDILTHIRMGPHPEKSASEWAGFYEELRYLGIDISRQFVSQQNQLNSRFVEDGRFLAVEGDASNLPEHPFFSLSEEERAELFAAKGNGAIGVADDGARELNPVQAIFLSNEFPDILPFHLVRIHKDESKSDELVSFVPILPEETYSRVLGLFRLLAATSGPAVVVEGEGRRLTGADIDQLDETVRGVHRSVRELCSASRYCIDEPLPVDYPPQQGRFLYLSKHAFRTILAAFSNIAESDEIPAAAEEELPAAELPSKPFIDDAAEQVGLSLAEKIFLELKWHVGFQPVGVPLESGPAFLRKNY
ncbi:MAG: SAM-dependent methyltransferase, partial [Acidobacteriota bacterium]|nr:SAM-dependent methyltransferase [Acidobacteriota bacterium]